MTAPSLQPATSSSQVVRVSIRANAGAFARSIDVSVPTSSSFSEILPEIARLIDLPQINRPWEFSTAAGAPLDPHTALMHMRLRDGAVLTLRPHEPVAPPVVRDAAESLAADSARSTPRGGIDLLFSLTGAVGAGLLVGAFMNPLAGVGLAALLLLTVAIVARSRVLFPIAATTAGLGCGAWVAGISDGPTTLHPLSPAVALGALSAVAVTCVLLAGGSALRLVSPRSGAGLVTASCLVAAGALGAWLPSTYAPAALMVLAGLAAVMGTPAAATRAAGLRIPRVPTAGQEFSIADDYQEDVDKRTHVARLVADGISIGVAACTVPALILLAFAASAWVCALGITLAGALLVHASRHHSSAPRLSLGLTAAVSAGSAVLTVSLIDAPHTALIALTILLTTACASAAIWARRIPELEPTTLVWIERAEAAAIIGVIPVAVYLTGIFDLIRGL